MSLFLTRILPIYSLAMALISVFVTVWDKRAARRGARRVPERTLMLLGLLGGALAMYITMRVIRHKTLHRKFMIGLPLCILLHAVLLAIGIWLLFSLDMQGIGAYYIR